MLPRPFVVLLTLAVVLAAGNTPAAGAPGAGQPAGRGQIQRGRQQRLRPGAPINDPHVRPALHTVSERAASKPLDRGNSSSARAGAASSPLPLPPRGSGSNASRPGPMNEQPRRSGVLASLGTAIGSLAVVLALFGAGAWALRRAMPAGPASLPHEVAEVLGRCPLGGRHQGHLLRCGNKIVLVYFSTAGAETLTEITDPVEVDRLAGICRAAHPKSSTAGFRNLLAQFSREKTTSEFIDRSDANLAVPALDSSPAGRRVMEDSNA